MKNTETSGASYDPMASHNGFKARLLICIDKCGSKYNLAKRSGLSKGAIQKYLGRSEPARDKLVALASAAGVSPFWLSFGVDPPAPTERTNKTAEPFALESGNCRTWIGINVLELVTGKSGLAKGYRRGSPIMMIRSDVAPQAFMGADSSDLAAFRMPDTVMHKTIAKNAWGIVHLGKMPGAGLYCVLKGGELTARHVSNDGTGNLFVSSDDPSTEPPRVYVKRELCKTCTVVGEVVVAGIWPKAAG
jgi:hypothetical protein